MRDPRPFLAILMVTILIVSVLSFGIFLPTDMVNEKDSENGSGDIVFNSVSPLANNAPTVNLTRPDGGENFTIGSNESIKWGMGDKEEENNTDLKVDIFYSNNTGADWQVIEENLTGENLTRNNTEGDVDPYRYNWTVPDDSSSDCLVKINVTDTDGKSSSDMSSDTFEMGEYELYIDSTDGGYVEEPGEGYFSYLDQTEVNLTAKADDSYEFVRWKGDNETVNNTDQNTTNITIEEFKNYTITAVFDKIDYGLGIASNTGGSVTNPGEGKFTYDEGTSLELEARPDDNYHFVNWTGDIEQIEDLDSNRTNITMQNDYRIKANFAKDVYNLTLNSTVGGNVTLPGEGTNQYNATEVVELKAEPDTNYHFEEWTGDNDTIGDVTDANTTITMYESYNVTAEFAKTDYVLTINSSSGGEIIEPGNGTFGYKSGDTIELEARLDDHYHFVNWTGDIEQIEDPDSNRTNITMNENHTIEPRFELNNYSLTIDSTNGGNVTRPGEGNYSYEAQSVIDLKAVADLNYSFERWTGDIERIADPSSEKTNITMEGDYNITAEFVKVEYNLTLKSSIGGNVTSPEEGKNSYEHGTTVELEARADDNHHFVNWTGDVATIEDPNSNRTNITIEEDYTVKAQFEKSYEVSVKMPTDQTENQTGSHGFSLNVKNLGNLTETFDLKSRLTDPDWSISMTKNVTVAPHTSKEVPFDITIPDSVNYEESSDIIVEAISQNNTDIRAKNSMGLIYRPDLSVEVKAPSDRTVGSTSTYTYNYSLSNTGGIEDSYDLSVSSSNSDWTVSFIENITVKAGNKKDVKFDLTIPKDVTDGESTTISFKATSKTNDTFTASGDMKVVYEEPEEPKGEVKVAAPDKKTVLNPGDYRWEFDVENNMNGSQTFEINTNIDVDWNVTPETSTIEVDSNESKNLAIEVNIPDDEQEGTDAIIELTVVSESDSKIKDSDSMSLTYDPDAGTGVNVKPPIDEVKYVKGNTTCNFTVENTGSGIDTYRISAKSDKSGWDVIVEDEITISPGDSEKVRVEVLIPRDEKKGNSSFIELKATSKADDTVSDSGLVLINYEGELERGISVKAPVNETVGSTDTFYFEFIVRNTGDIDSIYDLNVSNERDWITEINESSIQLSAREEKSVDVKVKILDDIDESGRIELTAVCRSNETVSDSAGFTIGFASQEEIDVKVVSPEDKVIDSSGMYEYEFTVKNTGEFDCTFDISVKTEEDWDISLDRSTITLSPSDEISVDLRIDIPKDIEDGGSNEITLEVESEDGSIKDSDSLKIEYKRNDGEQSIVPGIDAVLSFWSLIPLVLVIVLGIVILYLRRSETKGK